MSGQTRTLSLRDAALALPDLQRAALANELIAHVSDASCIAQLSRLAFHAGHIAQELERERQLRLPETREHRP